MATVYLKAHHISKGETIAQSMKDRFDYGQNPVKTRDGDLILSYECDPKTANAELRKMALNGYVLHVDLSSVRELISLRRRCANNLNQVAIHANTVGVYPEKNAGSAGLYRAVGDAVRFAEKAVNDYLTKLYIDVPSEKIKSITSNVSACVMA